MLAIWYLTGRSLAPREKLLRSERASTIICRNVQKYTDRHRKTYKSPTICDRDSFPRDQRPSESLYDWHADTLEHMLTDRLTDLMAPQPHQTKRRICVLAGWLDVPSLSFPTNLVLCLLYSCKDDEITTQARGSQEIFLL